MKKLIVILLMFLCLTSCEQTISRNFGGTIEIELEPGEKLVEATWKDDNLQYLVEPMDSDYIPKTKIFKESAVMGMMNGKVIFYEKR